MNHTWHKVIFGNCQRMPEIQDESIHLMVTSPPYFESPFDYKDFFGGDYGKYLGIIKDMAKEVYRVLAPGRVACINCDDMLVKGIKYPITADITKIFLDAGFKLRDTLRWIKPTGYTRISRRSGVLLQHPYPMYAYFDNLQESILIFQKGQFNYKSVPQDIKEMSKIDIDEFQKNKWNLTTWYMVNVLPSSKLEKGIAAFPEELPRRLIKLFSYRQETVLDPFLGSGTVTKVAKELGRNSVGYELKPELEPIILKKIDYDKAIKEGNKIEIVKRTNT